jgi:hypothetical protein
MSLTLDALERHTAAAGEPGRLRPPYKGLHAPEGQALTLDAGLDDAIHITFGIYDLDENGIDTIDEMRHLTVNLIQAFNITTVKSKNVKELVTLHPS